MMSRTEGNTTEAGGDSTIWRRAGAVFVLLLAASVPHISVRGDIVGAVLPESFSVCEDAEDDNELPREECQASDVRFQADAAAGGETDFGFSTAAGFLNGDEFEDLVVGDPERNRVYIFFGRRSVTQAYGLDPEDLADRMVAAETEADVILFRDPSLPGDVASLGFSVAVGRTPVPVPCPPSDFAAPVLIGAPGHPGETSSNPGTAAYVPAGQLCLVPSNPPSTVTLDPFDIGQALGAPVIEEGDEFGYSVTLGRLLTTTGTDEDVIVGARTATGGAGKVVVFPVTDGVVGVGADEVVEIVGMPGDGLGEVLAVGDLDDDFDDELDPFGLIDDLAVGAVGHETGKVLLVQGPLPPTGGPNDDGVFDESDPRLQPIVGEVDGDFFGFSVAAGAEGRLAVGAVFADNDPDGSPLTNVSAPRRINAGKTYVWNGGLFDDPVLELPADSADLVFVARRSGDQLGFAVAFVDADVSGEPDLVITARREDGTGLDVNEIDQGTTYILFDGSLPSSPVNLGQCVATSDCTGVAGVDVMIFGGDREGQQGDEMGFAVASGDFNGDGSAELYISSRTRNRVYAVTLDDADGDRAVQGRNLRDDDDDGDDDPDSTDCEPLDPDINAEAEEIACNGIDENCNGDEDDRPDADLDGFNACGDDDTPADCDDDDPFSFPDAEELCDGNDNSCDDTIPLDERDLDGDEYVACDAWDDTQNDDSDIAGGGDCNASDGDTFPGAAPNESDPTACMQDDDGDDYGNLSPASEVTPGTDCRDTDPATFPGAAELDDADACMRDTDDDGFGDVSAPDPIVPGSDCDDVDPVSFPGAPKLCDGNDNACTGDVAMDEADSDGDRYVACNGWDDTQADNEEILGGGDCIVDDQLTFPGAAPNEVDATACMRDADGDDFGELTPVEGVVPGTDCDDASDTAAATFPGAAPLDSPLNCMKDDDGDDYGDADAALPVVAGSDCDDGDPTIFGSATEVPDDGIDQDCNGTDTVTCFADDDLDDFGAAILLADDGDCTDPGESDVDTDCDDSNPDIFPGAPEIADDGIDQDCNDADTITCFVDEDLDGSGGLGGATTLADDGICDAEDGESDSSDDCDDADANTFPAAPELCDGNDNTCSGSVPVDETDGDGDGWVPCSGWDDTQGDDPIVAGGGDCDDTSTTAFPGAAPNETLSGACMKDLDGDDFGDLDPGEGITPGTDCDDDSPTAASTFPGAAELDGPLNCMKDVDGDDFGDASATLPIVAGNDCDDDDPTVFLGAPELCDGNDNACAGAVAGDEIDVDGDSWVACTGWEDTQGDDPDVAGGGDCDETDILTFPGAAPQETVPDACMKDLDDDDFGDLSPPAGVTAGTDCDDASPVTFPGAAAIDGPLNCMKDADDDDYGDESTVLPVVPGGDCDDGAPAVNPGVPEGPQGDPVCSDTLDNDCDGLVDGDDPVCAGTASACPDADDDGFADCTSDSNCDPAGLVCGDCDDSVGTVNPDADEVCDNVDNDCDASVDEGFDLDDDGFTSCDLPLADCDDDNQAVNPAAQELCGDGVDNDCDAATEDLFDGDGDGATCEVDCNDDDPTLNFDDTDMDTFSTCAGDCDDDDPAVNPGVPEVCDDGIDNDCNGGTLDIFDNDADGATCVVDCDDDDPSLNLDDADEDGFTSCDGDCDDSVPEVNPSATDSCDGIDNNCDGVVDEDFDLDEDGFSTCADPPDCNDSNPDVNPGAPEICNDGVNNDCDPGTPDIFDGDADGAACDDDCDDDDPTSYPGAGELCDGNDNACSGSVPTNEKDIDGDGFVSCDGWTDIQGDDPEILGGGDCDETDTDTFPGAAPSESVPTACMRDKDGDDFGDQSPPVGVVGGTDCDDGSAVTYPGAAEIDGPFNCMKDLDDDGYGDATVSLPVVAGTDCDDSLPAVNPAGTEGPVGDPTCSDGLDNDCDTTLDGDDPECSPPLPQNRGLTRDSTLLRPGRRSVRGR
jgi:hypothetical protein